MLALQLTFSTEIAFTVGLALVGGVALLFVVDPARRDRVRALVLPIVGAGALAAVLTAPFLYYAVTGFQSKAIHPPENFAADLLNLVVPTHLEASGAGWAHGISDRFSGNDFERDAFLGVPALAIVAWFGLRRWRSPGGRFLLIALALATLASLGSRLHVAGHRLVPLPWGLVDSLPLLDNVLPGRLMLFASLAAALIVAVWAASSDAPRWMRTLLPALAVLSLVPNPAANVWAVTVHLPSFFTSGAYRTCLRRDENILPLPVSNNGDSMLWQSESDFWFRMAGGYLTEGPPPPFAKPPAVAAIANNVTVPANQPQLIGQYVRLKRVTTIVVDERVSSDWRPVLDKIVTPQEIGGVLLYRVAGTSRPAGCSSA